MSLRIITEGTDEIMAFKKQKKDHVVIVTSDSENASVKKFRIKSTTVWTVIIIVCVIIGVLLGFIAYGERIWNAANQMMNQKVEEYEEKIAVLEAEKKALEDEGKALQTEIEGLNNKVTVLSDTITQMKAIEEELTAQVNRNVTPTLLPLTGSATIQKVTEGDPMSVFETTKGAVIVATAAGTVQESSEDADFGHRIVIDHGNGYVSIYRNEGDPLVAVGDSVSQGGVLFIVDDDNTRLGYQITKDGAYIDPSDMMEIKG